MDNNLSIGAWVCLGCVIVFVVVLNYNLWTAVKRKDSSQFKTFIRLGHAIRNPHKEEMDQLSELSQRVERLKKTPPAKKDLKEDDG